MMSIDLKVAQVDPPGIIMDVVDMPDPVQFGLTVQAFNYDSVGLYFQITGSKTGWTFGTVNLGLIGSGANLLQNLDNFCSRPRPASETSEQITLTLKAYTDAGYSILKWSVNKLVDVLFIKSDDGSWTQDAMFDFDDGTLQGWSYERVYGWVGCNPTAGCVTDYVLSPPYSGRMTSCNWELGGYNLAYQKRISIRKDATALLVLGKPNDNVASDYIPLNKWMRCIVPLPRNTTLTLDVYDEFLVRVLTDQQIGVRWYRSITTPDRATVYAIINLRASARYTQNYEINLWLDDVRIISRA